MSYFKYRKFKNSKKSNIFKKTSVISIICSKFGNENKKIFKEEKPIEILKILGLIENILLPWKVWVNKLFPWRSRTKWIND